MPKIRTVIVDDEALARERLRRLLESVPEIEIAGEAADGRSAVELIEREKPRLLFLDVRMPELNGFEVIEALPEHGRPNVVFVTAHDQFALKAFDVHAVDYLLKPFDRERFELALKRALEKIRAQAPPPDYRAAVREARGPGAPSARLLVKTEGRMLVIKTEDIDWIEAADNYVNLHAGPESHMMRETMTALEKRLPAEKFMRISRSAIVNIDRIKELQPMFHGEYVVILKTGARLTLSRTHRDKLDRLTGQG